MASDTVKSRRYYLPTSELYETASKFGSSVPAFNNIYDVFINFDAKSQLSSFIEQHNMHYGNKAVGSSLALYCSEAVLPGSSLQTTSVDGLRQGMSQHYATFRRFPDITLTWYTQQNYMTNDVFNAWMEFISPNEEAGPDSFRKMRYPNTYKIPMEITAFSKDFKGPPDRLGSHPGTRTPSSITYFIENAFPTSIVAAPLAYGKAELIKTSVSFKYENYSIKRTSRTGEIKSTSVLPRTKAGAGMSSLQGSKIKQQFDNIFSKTSDSVLDVRKTFSAPKILDSLPNINTPNIDFNMSSDFNMPSFEIPDQNKFKDDPNTTVTYTEEVNFTLDE